tara:strand:+ start:285 stop:653 length:369 start_codon:yes stop_codon:yes gene_type:complete
MLASLTALINPAMSILEKAIPDRDLREKLSHELAVLADNQMTAQIELNKVEAQGNWFQSSWRPATAWVCVAGFGVNFLVAPLAHPFGIIVPQIDTSVMLPVLMALLGLGTMRTFERVSKVGK